MDLIKSSYCRPVNSGASLVHFQPYIALQRCAVLKQTSAIYITGPCIWWSRAAVVFLEQALQCCWMHYSPNSGAQRMTPLTERYLLAAQEAHISALQQLPASCALVGVVCELIHQLQRERGISNIFLASASVLFASQREQQLQHSMLAAQQLYTALNFPEPQLAAGSRLFSKIALALQGMDQ